MARNEPRRPTPHEELTAQFYAWEKGGRGWAVHGHPVMLEPPFRPFFGHYTTGTQPAEDVRRPTFLGGIAEALRGESSRSGSQSEPIVYEEAEPEPEFFSYQAQLIEVEMHVPQDLKVSRERATQLLTGLANVRDPIVFELIGEHDAVSL